MVNIVYIFASIPFSTSQRVIVGNNLKIINNLEKGVSLDGLLINIQMSLA